MTGEAAFQTTSEYAHYVKRYLEGEWYDDHRGEWEPAVAAVFDKWLERRDSMGLKAPDEEELAGLFDWANDVIRCEGLHEATRAGGMHSSVGWRYGATKCDQSLVLVPWAPSSWAMDNPPEHLTSHLDPRLGRERADVSALYVLRDSVHWLTHWVEGRTLRRYDLAAVGLTTIPDDVALDPLRAMTEGIPGLPDPALVCNELEVNYSISQGVGAAMLVRQYCVQWLEKGVSAGYAQLAPTLAERIACFTITANTALCVLVVAKRKTHRLPDRVSLTAAAVNCAISMNICKELVGCAKGEVTYYGKKSARRLKDLVKWYRAVQMCISPDARPVVWSFAVSGFDYVLTGARYSERMLRRRIPLTGDDEDEELARWFSAIYVEAIGDEGAAPAECE
ncbi:hypothetical protein GQ54DRAFT_306843 [Martensiomyces pterosporus]|nr:hypothetical protein GQ54DRAFT_306843 [Martensiomyces pterosporus]